MNDALHYYQRVHDYRQTFSTPAGKRVLEDLCRSYQYTFDPDPFVSAFNQGRRQVVLDIERLVELANDPQFTEETVGEYFNHNVEESEGL